VEKALKSITMKSVKHHFPFLLEKIKVLFYAGQFDLRDRVSSNEAWIATIPWEGQEKFSNASHNVWKVNGNVAGFIKTYKVFLPR